MFSYKENGNSVTISVSQIVFTLGFVNMQGEYVLGLEAASACAVLPGGLCLNPVADVA